MESRWYLSIPWLASAKGGDIILSGAKGSTIDNKSIPIEGDTIKVTVPASSLIGIPMDKTQNDGKFY